MSGLIKLAVSCQLIFAAWAFPAAAASSSYETVLGPTPISHATKTALTGEGAAIATLSGNTLKVSGAFQGLSGAATDAHIMIGEGIGIPGNPILDLTASAAANGTIDGTFRLTRVQLAALRAGRLYIQVNSQAGPAPGGNLWGWLLPEHVKAGQDEPQLGDWFLPQGEGLRAARNGNKS
ncbi:MAG TPA: CHRD domain-containing protein [Rhizomicrobium sp.]|jgi:hypothetical protein|nr:CHRD domain-containing protein [Rhizomicrobium sp.]